MATAEHNQDSKHDLKANPQQPALAAAPQQTPAGSTAAPAEPPKKGLLSKIKISKKQKTIAIVVAACLFAVFAAHMIYRFVWYESTDDAFVQAHMHTISSRINGTVQQVLVDENYIVKKGDVLVKLDPRDYEVAIQEAQANYSKAHKDLGRFNGYLNNLGPTDRPVFDQYQAQALVTEAQLTRAQLQYEYTSIIAPEDGKMGKRSVETGEQVQPGQALFALLEMHPWIEANFKEHQVAKMRVGQPVEIDVDAIPDKSFTGRVESLSPGSGATFSLLPPDNATGNFTKIVQRIPVRIKFDPESIKGYEARLVSGMSTEISVKVR